MSRLNDMWNGQFSQETLDRLRRTLTESGAVDGVLEQPMVDRDIRDLVDHRNPLRQMVPRKSGSGTQWLLNRRTAGTTDIQSVSDTDAFDISSSSYARTGFTYRTLGTKGKVTRKAQASGASYVDLLMQEIEAKAKDFRDGEERKIIQDDDGNSNQFDGLWSLVRAQSGQIIAQTTTENGAEIDLNTMDRLVDRNRGNPSLILCSRAFRRQLASKLQAQQRFIDRTEIAAGFRVMTYNDIPVLPTTNIPDDIYYNGSQAPTHGNLTGGTGESTLAFVLDFDEFFIGELTQLTMMPLAKTSSQFDEFEIFEDIVPVLGNTLKISALYGVNTNGS